jgi:hypothetical protein
MTQDVPPVVGEEADEEDAGGAEPEEVEVENWPEPEGPEPNQDGHQDGSQEEREEEAEEAEGEAEEAVPEGTHAYPGQWVALVL